MNSQKQEELRYPIGHFVAPGTISRAMRNDWIAELEALPTRVSDLVVPLKDEQLDTPYRPEGWTVRQLVHHISDSHHNSYLRFKWALTEENPIIKPYDEKAWADLFDSRSAPVDLSLKHLEVVHAKLVYLLRGLTEAQLRRTFVHPDGNQQSTLEVNIGRYAWHGNHHLAHIENLLKRRGWLD